MAVQQISQLCRVAAVRRTPIAGFTADWSSIRLSSPFHNSTRHFSTSLRRSQGDANAGVAAPEYLDEGERRVFDLVKDGLSPTKLEVMSKRMDLHLFRMVLTTRQVQDVSGGCGSMYALDIVSERFRGLSVIKQHRLVNSILGDEIKKWHGVQMKTKAP